MQENKIINFINFNFPKLFLRILLLWLVVNIFQSIFTGISDDEAYYWQYANHLAWGYFDHPPMVALFIKLGGLVFKKELGVRIVSNIAQCICLCFTWLIVAKNIAKSKQQIYLFFIIASSIIMFQVYGFITTPDAPLLLFVSFFLYAYQQFLKNDNKLNTILISIAMAGLVYSKYQGGIFIVIVLISNIKLLKNYKFWLASIFAIALFIPHIYWQISHQFPSFKYHLIDRATPFEWFYVVEFWLNQIVVYNPIFLGITLFCIYKYKSNSAFEKTLNYIVIGFLLFFWGTAIRGHVEPHWTIAAAIPMLIIVFNNCLENAKISKIIKQIFPIIITLIIIARVILTLSFLPIPLEFFGKKTWVKNIESIAKNKPVVFINSYQAPSVYSFYSGKPSFSFNNIGYRQNQYDIWDLESNYQNKPAILISDSTNNIATKYTFDNNENIYAQATDSLVTIQKLKVSFDANKVAICKQNSIIDLPIQIYNPYPQTIVNVSNFSFHIVAVFFTKKDKITKHSNLNLDSLQAHQTFSTTIHFNTNEIPLGKYPFCVSIYAGNFGLAFNSKVVNALVIPSQTK